MNQQIALKRIRPYSGQPRKRFDEAKLEELAASIQAVGQIVPAEVVRRGRMFELVDGERRWRACRIAGQETLLCTVLEALDEREQFRRSVAANCARDSLTPLETGQAIARLVDEGLTLDQAASLFGRSKSWADMYLALTGLAPPVRQFLEADQIGPSVARVIARLPDAQQERIARRAIQQEWGVFETNREVRKLLGLQSSAVRAIKPSDDRARFVTFIKQLKDGSDRWRNLTEAQIRKMFAPIPFTHRAGFATRLEDAAGELMMLAELVEKTVRILNHEDQKREAS